MLLDPNQLAALGAVLRLGAFEAAAQALSVTPSAISQRIKALEEHVGTALVHRGQPCHGTETGKRLAKHAEDVALLEAQLNREIGRTETTETPRLRCALNADSLATWFIPAMATATDVLFDLVVDDQDHSADWLRRGEVSAAVTAAGKVAPGCDAYDLGALRYVATASPDFVKKWCPQGVTAEAMREAPCLIFNAKDALQRRWLDSSFGARLAPPAHFLPSSQAFVEAAKAGIGWGMNPHVLVSEDIARGNLVELVPGTSLDVPLIWQVSRIMKQAISPVTRAVLASAKSRLIQRAV